MSHSNTFEKKHSSCSGLLSMLEETDRNLQIYALQKLSTIISTSWHEIADKIASIESFIDDPSFPEKELVAHIVSQVFYYLEEYDEALRLALISGHKFDLNEQSQYVETLIHKCVDLYIEKRQLIHDKQDDGVVIDHKMEDVMNKMFDRAIQSGQQKEIIGIAIESRRLDRMKEAIEKSSDIEETLSYTFTIAENQVKNKNFRNEILRLILTIYEAKQSQSNSNFDYFKICKCQFLLNMHESAAILLSKLVKNDLTYLQAYQISFDIVDNENQAFQNKIIENLKQQADIPQEHLKNLMSILTGEIKDRLTLQFLKKNNHTDMLLLTKIKEKIGQKNSVTHGACVWANGIMNAYTTNDAFLRDNIQWAALATNWNRFNATATLGVIHMGNKKESMQILQPYFSGAAIGNQQSSPYSTAGAYYAYGLIHANQYTEETYKFFMDGFRNSGQNESIQHGICLGLGLNAMATKSQTIYEELKNILFNNADSAIIGEAAGYGLGLVMLGSMDQDAITEILTHCAESTHEKIIRSLSISLALVMYGKEELADTLIEQMVRSKDSIVRYGAMFGIGCAYAGTSNNAAVKKLLHYAVSDVSDDVKRASLINIGFLLFRQPQKIPELMKQLAESYNPHLRYGAAYAVGIGCAGTGLMEALKLLAPLTNDNVDFVRQAALISLALVFIQVTEAQEPKVATIKKLYTKMSEDKHEEILSKMGAIVAQGIINASGRNATIQLTTRDGSLKQNAVVGLVMFLQHWYWYPCLNFLSLSLTPTALIGLNKDLKVPKNFKILSQAKPSLFKYPPFMKKEENKAGEKVQTAVLSTTVKAKARQDRKQEKEGGASMQIDSQPKEASTPVNQVEANKDGEKKEGEEDKKDKPDVPEEEPNQQELNNPTRVLRAQEQKIQYLDDGVYYPILPSRKSGFIVLNKVRESTEQEAFYDDEERDPNAPNPDMHSDIPLPQEFEFDPSVQNAQ